MAHVGGLGSGSGTKLAVLVSLGAKEVGLGHGSGPQLTVLACLGAKASGRSWKGIRPECGPNPSGKAIWTGDQAEKWPKPKREKVSGPPRTHRPNAHKQFFN
jgi:hypothetical protein